MNRFSLNGFFTIYIAILGAIFLYRIPYGSNWFNQWIFDKFFVFQFMSVITVGLAILGSRFNNLTFIRMGSRRKILGRELLGYYIQGWIWVTITFLFIGFGALLLEEVHVTSDLANWYFRYLLGVILFINVMSCIKWSNLLIARKYAALIAFAWMALEMLAIGPYLDANLLFSWIFHRGAESYLWLSGFILITTLLNIKLGDKRDFM